MSRKEPTKNEIILREKLIEYLKAMGHNVIPIKREIEDRPDIAFALDEIITGCECIQVPSNDIYKWIHKKFDHLSFLHPTVVEVVWPHEPHTWIAEAIRSKRNKISAYKRSISAEKIFLLIHSPIEVKQEFMDSKGYFVKELMQVTASNTEHTFDEIYFYDEKIGMLKLFPNDLEHTGFIFDFNNGYPVMSFVLSHGSLTTTEVGEDRKLYDSGPLEPYRIDVQPRDPEFKKHKRRMTNNKYKIVFDVGSNDAGLKIETIVQN